MYAEILEMEKILETFQILRTDGTDQKAKLEE